jgi:isopenicillin N synthase-like dioxygenase
MSDSIPVIDIGRLAEPRTLHAIDAACRDWGFFQVTGHGIDARICDDVFGAARSFFAQPDDVKRSILRTADNPWGYYDRELTKNTRDWKQVYDYGPPDGGVIEPQWPRGLPAFAASVRNYFDACERVAQRLLGAIAVNLGVAPATLAAGFGAAQTSFVRLNYYPACPLPAVPSGTRIPAPGFLGVNHHTDAGALTLLLQDDVPGLEVMREGRWHLVEPRHGALVINIGDIVQVWSNDRYRAALHRALTNAEHERYSAPFFYNPSYQTHYAPLPTTVDAEHPARYRAIPWGEFRARRSAGDYADYGEEVQISHYAL